MKTKLAATVFFLAALSVYGQAVSLDEAIRNAAQYLMGLEQLPKNARVAFLDFSAPNKALSDYILPRLESQCLEYFIIVDRKNIELRRQELALSLNMETSQETELAIGKMLSAYCIVTGSMSKEGNAYTLKLRPLIIETSETFPFLVEIKENDRRLRSLLSQKDDSPDDGSIFDSLHDKNRLYLGARAGLSLGFYDNGGGLADRMVYPSQALQGIPAFDAALWVAVPIWSLFALHAEALFTNDSFDLISGNTSLMTVSYNSLMIPLLAKVVWRPSRFMAQGFAGAYLSLPMGQMEVKHNNGSYSADVSLLGGFMAGGELGVKLGPGTIIADIRYATDFGNLTASYNGTRDISHRNNVFFALGYEFGLIPKK